MRILLNDGWSFAKLGLGSSLGDAAGAAFVPVHVPHDWLISQPENLYENSDGWYRRTLDIPEGLAGRPVLVRFEGVYQDSEVYLNGSLAGGHHYGYTPFEVDVTSLAHAGSNELLVHVRHAAPNSRWYSGAGIFRDVRLIIHEGAGLVTDGVFALPQRQADGSWLVRCSAELFDRAAGEVAFRVLSPDGDTVGQVRAQASGGMAAAEIAIAQPVLWQLSDPRCYALEAAIDGDAICQPFGLRTVEMNPDTGFWLNGQRLKLNGVCLHHDLGPLGAAFSLAAARRQLLLMRGMGVNALRTSHNPPDSGVLALCDELGILVVDEAFDMWRRHKTPNDYATWFDQEAELDIAAMVRRDRNHPCVIAWSIGNEIYDTFADAEAVDITRRLQAAVAASDPSRPATIGSNYMPWEGAQHCAEVLKLAGYNYGESYYEAHHAAHPDWIIYGSETASILQSRGVYHFPLSEPILADEDEQCSVLGNSHNSWGAHDPRAMLYDEAVRPYSLGQFIWAGIDYIGEPTPYHTRSSYFGQVDTAGFPKDSYYLYQAAWGSAPMCHIGVTWDWNPGQLIDIPVYSNADTVELLLNGRSLGTQKVERWRALWQLPFEPGTLRAVARDAQGRTAAVDERVTSGDSARLCLSCQRQSLLADGQDFACITVTALDRMGVPVENAIDRVRITVRDAALLAMDNGDSTDHDGYQTDSRRLFAGKLIVLAGAATAPGEAVITAQAPGLEPATLTLQLQPAALPADREPLSLGLRLRHPAEEPVAARRLVIRPIAGGTPVQLSPDAPSADFSVTVLPENAATQEIRYRVVTAAGIDSPCATLTPIPGGVRVTGCGDGEVYLRATVNNGDTHARIISQLEVRLTGFGKPCLDPYGFITGGLYDLHDGVIGVGNELGLAFARDGYSMAGFSNVDFGPGGSDEITIPIFALSGDLYQIDVWQGDPREGGRHLATLDYRKPSIWNTYQAETWRLPVRLRGIQTICFSMTSKVHMKGFSFTRQERAFSENTAASADTIYGDSFRMDGDAVREIGNNVTLSFGSMDFGQGGPVRLYLTGRTPLEKNAVNVRFTDAAGVQSTQMCPFLGQPETGTQAFDLTAPAGLCTVDFIFLPGCQFDFVSFRFERQ